MEGDASSRRYTRLEQEGKTAILMEAPGGAAVVGGAPECIPSPTRLAESIFSFLALADLLREQKIATPEIYAAEQEIGLILLEDFGTEGILLNGKPDAKRMEMSVETLVQIHTQESWPRLFPTRWGGAYTLLSYDNSVLWTELLPFLEYFFFFLSGQKAGRGLQSSFQKAWMPLLLSLQQAEQSLVLRDFHSPNLLWRAAQKGTAQVGVLDFQDALWGPSAYDLVSLLQDARVDVSLSLENKLLAQYCARRHFASPKFDPDLFQRAYAILGVQRAMKVLGVFCRLALRDQKPAYLIHLPRVLKNLERGLQAPLLAPVAAWYAAYLSPYLPLRDREKQISC